MTCRTLVGAIALRHTGAQDRLQFHHIFPKAALKSLYTSREADDIANLAFIGGKTNRQIADKEPASYLPPISRRIGSEPFEAQCIPTAPEMLSLDKYRDFLTERRRLVADRLNSFLSAG